MTTIDRLKRFQRDEIKMIRQFSAEGYHEGSSGTENMTGFPRKASVFTKLLLQTKQSFFPLGTEHEGVKGAVGTDHTMAGIITGSGLRASALPTARAARGRPKRRATHR
jgi:hypothetical protein